MLEVISDSTPNGRELLEKRLRMQMEGVPIEHSQMSLDKYLDRLNFLEREGILGMLDGIRSLASPYFRKEIYPYALFGVGTITYSDEYWKEIEKIAEKDSSKRKYLENKGEDIDLMFCPEYCEGGRLLVKQGIERKYAERFNKKHLPTQAALFYHRKRLSKKMDKIGFNNLDENDLFVWKDCFDLRTMITALCIERKWKHTPWTDGAPFGTSYFEVPEKYVEREKQKVVRIKGENWGMQNMNLTMPGCRTFHIYIDTLNCRAHKVEYERNINLPFTLIHVPGTDLRDDIRRKNGTYVPRVEFDSLVLLERDKKEPLF
jgi:hypothetical protein